MADNKETLLRFMNNGITQTSFIDIPLQAGTIARKLAPKGKCKAVVLRLNSFDLNTETATDAPYFYVGDSTFQTTEVITGVDSQVIFCNDLSEVWVRYPVLLGRVSSITIRVMIYN